MKETQLMGDAEPVALSMSGKRKNATKKKLHQDNKNKGSINSNF